MPSPKYLALADLHVGGCWDRLDRTDDVFKVLDEQVLPLLRKMQSDGVRLINLGDLFHTNDPTPRQTARMIAFYQRLEGASIPSITLEGNHDHKGRSEKGSAIEPLLEVQLTHAMFVHRQPRFIDGFLAIPHMNAQDLAACLPDVLAQLDQQVEPLIGLCHLDLPGVAAGAERLVMRHQPGALPQQLIDHPKIRYWLCGHIHKPQIVGKLVVVGSLLQNDFSEVGEAKHLIVGDGEGTSVVLIECQQLRQIDLDFTDPQRKDKSEEAYQALLARRYDAPSLGINQADIVKITVRISDEDYVGRDFRGIEDDLAKHCRLLYRISPTIVRTREYRMRQLDQAKTDEEIATEYLAARARKDRQDLTAKAVQAIQEGRAGC